MRVNIQTTKDCLYGNFKEGQTGYVVGFLLGKYQEIICFAVIDGRVIRIETHEFKVIEKP